MKAYSTDTHHPAQAWLSDRITARTYKSASYLLVAMVCLGGAAAVSSGKDRNGGGGITNTSASPSVKLRSVDMDAVRWTDGFWAQRFEWCHKVVIPNMWKLLDEPQVSHAFENFRVAAGMTEGGHRGPKWHDGDFYKWLEAAALVYAITRDKGLDRQIDQIIEVIGKTQRSDGYIHTPVIIAERQQQSETGEFQNRLDFETYNMGHLMTCACIHHRATG